MARLTLALPRLAVLAPGSPARAQIARCWSLNAAERQGLLLTLEQEDQTGLFSVLHQMFTAAAERTEDGPPLGAWLAWAALLNQRWAGGSHSKLASDVLKTAARVRMCHAVHMCAATARLHQASWSMCCDLLPNAHCRLWLLQICPWHIHQQSVPAAALVRSADTKHAGDPCRGLHCEMDERRQRKRVRGGRLHCCNVAKAGGTQPRRTSAHVHRSHHHADRWARLSRYSSIISRAHVTWCAAEIVSQLQCGPRGAGSGGMQFLQVHLQQDLRQCLEREL